MRAAIYNPYWDTLGGGERYTITVAKVLRDAGYSVDLEWSDDSIIKKLESRFGLDLKNINVVPDTGRGDGYDVCFWVSDGSIPTLKARTNLLHFQVPFQKVGGGGLMNKMKFYRVNKIICNSIFTKGFVDKEFGVDSVVLHPPIDTENIKPKTKENIILSVGRFSQLKQAKRQDALVLAFKKLYDKGVRWRLFMAGGVEVGGGEEYVESLRKSSEGYPVTILESPTFKKITELYGKAKIFWSAAGFGINERMNPEKVEHFGMAVVESMSAGAVPIVFSAGGHKEIVENDRNGILWETELGLANITESLILDKTKLASLSKAALSDSKKYSYKSFKAQLLSYIK